MAGYFTKCGPKVAILGVLAIFFVFTVFAYINNLDHKFLAYSKTMTRLADRISSQGNTSRVIAKGGATKPYTVRFVTGHVTPVTPVDFRIIVIVYNRAKSLQECLDSLNTVDYMGDKVGLDVWIDRSKTGVIDGATFTVAKNFRFKGGDVIVHNQTKHVGILGQWMDSWQVKPDTKEIAVILEDDMSAGPFMWKWLKAAYKQYGSRPDVSGFSLCWQKLIATTGSHGLSIPYKYNVYMYKVLGTWGFAPTPKAWIGMRDFHHTTVAKDKNFEPLVPGIVPSGWYKTLKSQGREETIWEMWNVYWSYKHGTYTVYPNIPGHEGMASNRKEPGLHQGPNDARPKDPLVMKWKDEYIKFPKTPARIGYDGKVEKDAEL